MDVQCLRSFAEIRKHILINEKMGLFLSCCKPSASDVMTPDSVSVFSAIKRHYNGK